MHKSFLGIELLPLQSQAKASSFWKEAFALNGSITLHVLPNVLLIGLYALLVCAASWLMGKLYGVRLTLSIAPHEFIGAALSLLLILRTNSGYERWWEARKLWGGIVNQCRNLAISATSYGPQDEQWRKEFITWVAAFPHAARATLRQDRNVDQLNSLLKAEDASDLGKADHMPMYVAYKLALLLRQARQAEGLDGFAFMQIDKERAQLIDHIGACERIMKTPLALAYSIKIRRFIALFLLTLPFALIHEAGHSWLVPAVSMLVAYPLFSLDQLGAELQNPFDKANLSHLPLEDISATIEKNVQPFGLESNSGHAENKTSMCA
jgi:putative membrane protein